VRGVKHTRESGEGPSRGTRDESISMLVGLIHQILHFNLLPAALVSSVSHASCILLAESGWDISFTATPGCSNFVSEARRQSEESQHEEQEAGQTDHEKQEGIHRREKLCERCCRYT
jgi:hypothetical protein